MILVSPQEPNSMYELGEVDTLPEEFGCDFMWEAKMGKVGIQRKQFPGDFLASIHDGRLNKEYLQMQGLDVKVLLLEGRGKWTNDGVLIEQWGFQGDKSRRRLWDKTQHRNYLSSVQILKGVAVHQSEGMRDTRDFIKDMFIWTMKDEHLSLETRPAAQAASYWAEISNRDYQRYLLMSLPIIGPKLADAILDTLGQIFTIHVSYEDLLEVPGIGPGRARGIMDVFEKLEASND